MSVAHILFIDGYDQDRVYYVQRLKYSLLDFAVLEACTGRAGLDLYSFRKIDCVILELDLPDMSGLEVLAKLVPIAHNPEVPVVVLTRLINRSVLDLARKNGAQAALQKDMTSGDCLDKAILEGIAKVPRSSK